MPDLKLDPVANPYLLLRGMRISEQHAFICDSIFVGKRLEFVRHVKLAKGHFFANPIGYRGREGFLYRILDEYEESPFAMEGRYVVGGLVWWKRMLRLYPGSFDPPEYTEGQEKRVRNINEFNAKFKPEVNPDRGYKYVRVDTKSKIHPALLR